MIIRVLFASLLLAPTILLFAQGEHPGTARQSQSQIQSLPPTAAGSSRSTMQPMLVNVADISAGLRKYIDRSARKSPDRKFHIKYGSKDLALDLIKVHDDRLSSLGGSKYFACVDMKAANGTIYDIDFFTDMRPGQLTVTEASVHKINGKPLYNWKEKNGVWKKVHVS
jgi:hypothetical protein